jgi:hypothetical protein
VRSNRGGTRARTGPERAWSGRPVRIGPGAFWPGLRLPFALGVCLFIASAAVDRHIEQIILPTPFTRKPPPRDEGESWMSSLQGSMPVEGRKQEEDSKPLA